MFFTESSIDKNSYESKMELSISQNNFNQNLQNIDEGIKISIPCEIFRQGLSGLEAIVKYLKEQHSMQYSKIGSLINRDQRTVWVTYNKAKSKQIFFKENNSCPTVSISSDVLKNRELSVLESVSLYLKNLGFSVKKIALILGKNEKTVWTVLSRAKKKLDKKGVKNE